MPITEDVDRLDQATVNADGTFRPAKSGEQVVGRFLTAGDANSTAIVDVNLTDMGTVGDGVTSAPNPTGTTTTSTDKKETK